MLLLPVLASFALAGCGPTASSSNSSSSGTEDISSSSAQSTITAVTIKAAGDATSVSIGGTLQLTAEVTGTGDFGKNVTWESSDKTIATVAAGLVTGVKAGKVTITATSKDDATKKGTIDLDVAEVINKISEIKAQDIYNIKAVVIAKDLGTMIVSDNSAAIAVYFAVTDNLKNYAVNDYLQIKGTAYDYYGVWQFYGAISATDTGHEAVAITKLTETAPTITCEPVELTTAVIEAHKATPSDWNNAAMKYVKLTQSKLTIVKGSKYDTFKFFVGDYEVRLHSLDTTVFSGLASDSYYDVVAVDYGWNSGNSYENIMTTKITLAETPSGIVEVTAADGATSLFEKKTLQLTATETGVADATFTWSTSAEAVATVDSATGLVTGVKAGDVTITATANDTHSASIDLAVKSVEPVEIPADGLTLSETTLKAASADEWGKVSSSYPESITATVNGISVIGSVNKNVMFTGSYDPWKKTDTGLAYNLVQVKKNTGVAFAFGNPLVSAKQVVITCYATYSTEAPEYLPTVQVAETDAAITDALTDGSYAGTKFVDYSYTDSKGATKTGTIYSYVLHYDVSALSKQALTITAQVSGTSYIDNILITK